MPHVHFQVRVGVFSCQDKYFVIFDFVAKNKSNVVSVVCTLVDNDTRHHSGQNVVQQIELHHKAPALL